MAGHPLRGWLSFAGNMKPVHKEQGDMQVLRMMDLEKSIKTSTADREEQRTEASGVTARFWRLLENKFNVVSYSGDGSWHMGVEANRYKIAGWRIWAAEREMCAA